MIEIVFIFHMTLKRMPRLVFNLRNFSVRDGANRMQALLLKLLCMTQFIDRVRINVSFMKNCRRFFSQVAQLKQNCWVVHKVRLETRAPNEHVS